MNLKVLMGLIVYYVLIGGAYTFGQPYFDGATTTAGSYDQNTTLALNGTLSNSSGYVPGSSELDITIWNVIQRIGETLLFIFFGIGLPAGTPVWFALLFSLWQTAITILGLGVVLDAIHTG